ncbi:acyloxyacyl hydrolase [Synoicihabitans lomoniglobus]|uniref:Acyloxyacyl hydrolase n=1 Tax=Synoicihabitans lomoniglobus TaxID=2909285 RepID=A0AAE9ZW28_9BACT|nr:acyloxyacyl hydrolase [Opitutaceae bacterium LMO-M01]WED64466.1 acyloxyacyl hydrolase [Opitutaceae bacterium LMO-M01]
MQFFYRTVILGFALTAALRAADEVEVPPWSIGTISTETGMLWQIGTGTPLSYRLVPTQIAWRSGAIVSHAFANGSRVVLRHRFGLIGTWVQQGPESFYAGLTASPSIEWWDKSGTWALYAGSGGGAGVIDSRGVRGGQGQDFTFNWFIRGGVERVVSRNYTVTAGILYQHMSNGGQTDPNPGIDALGFTLGVSRSY